MKDIDWMIKPVSDWKIAYEKNKNKNKKKKASNKLKFCKGCKMVWEIGMSKSMIKYDQMPTYGLKRVTCSMCKKNNER